MISNCFSEGVCHCRNTYSHLFSAYDFWRRFQASETKLYYPIAIQEPQRRCTLRSGAITDSHKICREDLQSCDAAGLSYVFRGVGLVVLWWHRHYVRQESKCLLGTFFCLVLVLFILTAAGVVAGFLLGAGTILDEVGDDLLNQMDKYKTDDKVKKSWDWIQQNVSKSFVKILS